MYKVITFGSATLDIFLEPRNFLVKKENKFRTGRSISFPFSSKVDVDKAELQTGGGGTNSASFLSHFGFKTAYYGTVGDDFAGKKVLEDLQRFGVDDRFVEEKEAVTNFSVIFSVKKDRTVFVYREASELLEKKNILKDELGAEWFYLAPLSGKSKECFEPLVSFARENGTKVFANPGNSQIRMGVSELRPVLEKIDILLLNQEEASLLTDVSFKKEKEVFQKLDELVPGLAVMTKAEKGALASDGETLWRAPALEAKVVEKTGAGDAFGSGFLAGYLEKGEVEYALQLGIANAASCIGKKGAKNGFLSKKSDWERVKVEKEKI